MVSGCYVKLTNPVELHIMWQSLCAQVSDVTGEQFTVESSRPVGGGSINSAYVIFGGQRSFFVKTNSASRLDMFQAEYDGLNEIAQSNSIRVPVPVCVGIEDSQSYIVMENLNIHRGMGGNNQGIQQLGADLANMHRYINDQFGWYRDNTIGSTPQMNDQSPNWVDFFRDYRLGFQYRLAAKNGSGNLEKRGELLMSKLDAFFSGYRPSASLLHGDLWSGNYAIDDSGIPVIFDPATYYGDREADIAMTELFGGFSQRFYSAYNESYPLNDGYSTRKTLYNLYHILNHYNLFGASYLSQAEHMTEQLLSEL